ncbi:unnamed protein product [Ranitomeya imitator]|uniref:Uncharacterized protein n=1 Tax=Ranitomeya imitator TaxID=111125 RepID=A0ABN9KM72_9NEOB|nr:unnamed protein product [Ranitomeya imitator]
MLDSECRERTDMAESDRREVLIGGCKEEKRCNHECWDGSVPAELHYAPVILSRPAHIFGLGKGKEEEKRTERKEEEERRRKEDTEQEIVGRKGRYPRWYRLVVRLWHQTQLHLPVYHVEVMNMEDWSKPSAGARIPADEGCDVTAGRSWARRLILT